MEVTHEYHQILHAITGAMEVYGESVVSDLVARFGDDSEIGALINVEAGIKLKRMAGYHTHDGITFVKNNGSTEE